MGRTRVTCAFAGSTAQGRAPSRDTLRPILERDPASLGTPAGPGVQASKRARTGARNARLAAVVVAVGRATVTSQLGASVGSGTQASLVAFLRAMCSGTT